MANGWRERGQDGGGAGGEGIRAGCRRSLFARFNPAPNSLQESQASYRSS